MLVSFAKNQTLVSIEGETTECYTDPQAMGENNYVNLALNTETHINSGGTLTLTYQVEGSNNSQKWFEITALTDSATATGIKNKESAANCAFIRVKHSLAISAGGGSDYGASTFDLQANLTQQT